MQWACKRDSVLWEEYEAGKNGKKEGTSENDHDISLGPPTRDPTDSRHHNMRYDMKEEKKNMDQATAGEKRGCG